MTTIKERAMISVLGDYPIEHIQNWKAPIGEHDQAEIKGYVNGATEQKRIDLEKALAYWHKILDSQGINQVVFVDFIELMEEE